MLFEKIRMLPTKSGKKLGRALAMPDVGDLRAACSGKHMLPQRWLIVVSHLLEGIVVEAIVLVCCRVLHIDGHVVSTVPVAS